MVIVSSIGLEQGETMSKESDERRRITIIKRILERLDTKIRRLQFARDRLAKLIKEDQ